MIKKEKKMNDDDTFRILEKGSYGVLGTVTPEGAPYGIPLNYCTVDGNIYFHSATEGKKPDCFKNNNRVSFCVVTRSKVIPEKFDTDFESCIVEGVIDEVSGEEKFKGLKSLIEKYSEDFFEEGLKFIKKPDKKTKVFRIKIEEISGKASRPEK